MAEINYNYDSIIYPNTTSQSIMDMEHAKTEIIYKLAELEKVCISRVVIKNAMIGVSYGECFLIERCKLFEGIKTVKMIMKICTTNPELVNSEVMVLYKILPEPIIFYCSPVNNVTGPLTFQSNVFGSGSGEFSFGHSSSPDNNVTKPTEFQSNGFGSGSGGFGFGHSNIPDNNVTKPTAFQSNGFGFGSGSGEFSFGHSSSPDNNVTKPTAFQSNGFDGFGFGHSSRLVNNVAKPTPFQSTGFGTEGFGFGHSSSLNTNVNKYTPIYNSENNIKPGSYVWYSKKNAVVKILDYNMESNSYTILYEDRMIDTTDEFLRKLYIKG